jgi:hypothetical protein
VRAANPRGTIVGDDGAGSPGGPQDGRGHVKAFRQPAGQRSRRLTASGAWLPSARTVPRRVPRPGYPAGVQETDGSAYPPDWASTCPDAVPNHVASLPQDTEHLASVREEEEES